MRCVQYSVVIGAPGPKLVEHLGLIKTYPLQWRKSQVTAAELAKLRFIDNWSRKRLAKHFGRPEESIQWWFAELKRRDFKFKSIDSELRATLKRALLKQGE